MRLDCSIRRLHEKEKQRMGVLQNHQKVLTVILSFLLLPGYIFTECGIVVSSIIDIRHVSVVVVTFGFGWWETLGVGIVSGSIAIHSISVGDDSPRCNPFTTVIPLLRFRWIA